MRRQDELIKQIIAQQGPLGYARMAHEHESAMMADADSALVVRPTTTAMLTIFNGEAVGGKVLVIDRLFAFNLVTTAAQTMFSLWYCNHAQLINVAKPSNDITAGRGTGDGREPDISTVRVDEGATVVDDGWFPCGNWGEGEEAGVLPGCAVEWECNGRLIVYPKAALSLSVVAGTTGQTFTCGASWWRTQL
jgi:hypothetical protein